MLREENRIEHIWLRKKAKGRVGEEVRRERTAEKLSSLSKPADRGLSSL